MPSRVQSFIGCLRNDRLRRPLNRVHFAEKWKGNSSQSQHLLSFGLVNQKCPMTYWRGCHYAPIDGRLINLRLEDSQTALSIEPVFLPRRNAENVVSCQYNVCLAIYDMQLLLQPRSNRGWPVSSWKTAKRTKVRRMKKPQQFCSYSGLCEFSDHA